MTLVFLHIPKAGGNTFLQYMLPNFDEDRRFDVNLGLDYPKRLHELETLPETTKTKLDLIYGHLPFGVHQWIPQSCRYITFLRDPVDRVASHYFFVREQTRHPLHDAVVSRRMSLADYVNSGLSGELNNGMTRLLCGEADSDSLRGHADVSETHLNAALKHISEHFDAVCFVEQFDRSLRLLSRLYGWPERQIRRKNVTKNRTPTNQLSDSDRQAVEDANELDRTLYQQALQRFDQCCAENQIIDAADQLVTPHTPGKLPKSFVHRILAVLGLTDQRRQR